VGSFAKRQIYAFLLREKNTMETMMAVVLTDGGEFEVAATGGLGVSPRDAQVITGWTLKPEGMCRDELCVPLGDEARRDCKVDIAAFWRTLGHPLVYDTSGEVWDVGHSRRQPNGCLDRARGA
jgi:hypothetical protein